MPRRKTDRAVIAGFRGVHGDYYDYSSVEYVNSQTKVKVGCPVHGVFEITPEHHRKGVGCRNCYFSSQKTSKSEFVSRVQKYFVDRYDYSLFNDLPKPGEKVPILCRQHDEVFWQEPRNHMRGHTGCPRCKSIKLTGPRAEIGTIKSAEELKQAFIKRAESAHGCEYDYSEFAYVNSHVRGKIICSQHGAFWQAPSNHLRGSKCPDCSHERRKADTFKAKCKKLGVDSWRALTRRKAGLPEERIFEEGYVWNSRQINEITVSGVKYPNLEEAVRILKPPASSATIGRWIEEGMTPEEAFEHIPNPGYANGIIYLITHKATGKQYVGLTIQTLERRWKYHIEQAAARYMRGRGILLTEHVVANWRCLWQRGEPYGHDSLHQQDFSQMGPPNAEVFSPVSPHHPLPACRMSRATWEDV